MCKDFANFVEWSIHLGLDRLLDKSNTVLVVGVVGLERLKKYDKFVCSITSPVDCCAQVVGVCDGDIVVYSPQIEDDSVYKLFKGHAEWSEDKSMDVCYDTVH